MNFLELKTRVRNTLFVEGEGENLVAAHDEFFVQALTEIQRSIECYQFNNVSVHGQCATYFNCGMTVLPAPRGEILKVYVLGSDKDTGKPDWCSKVFYYQVDYCHIERYVQMNSRCRTKNSIFSSALVWNLFSCGWRNKSRYPCPDDAGLEALPALPQGFHYPQSSTDAGGRAPGGVWALYRGRLYIAPWIESTETLVVEWNGIKTNWDDADLVEDDPMFVKAIRLNVGIQHYSNYEENPERLAEFKRQYHGVPGEPGIVRELILKCRDQMKLRSCDTVGGKGSGARGMGLEATTAGGGSALFSNQRQTFTANCPTGQTGTPVTSVIEAGAVGSAISVADANARALQMAMDDANARLVCETNGGLFFNVAQPFTATCPGPDDSTGRPAAIGDSVTVVVEAGKFQSAVSQAAADAAALDSARQQAMAQLKCTFYNAPQTFQATCPSPSIGDPVSKTVSAGQFSSLISQSDADAQALADAQSQAASALSCSSGVFIIGNTVQTVSRSGFLTAAGCPAKPFSFNVVIAADTYKAGTTAATQAQVQLMLNQQALSAANAKADSIYNNLLLVYQLGCHPLGTGS